MLNISVEDFFYRIIFAAMYEASRSGLGRIYDTTYSSWEYLRKKRDVKPEATNTESEDSSGISEVLSGKRLAHVFRALADTAETFDRYFVYFYSLIWQRYWLFWILNHLLTAGAAFNNVQITYLSFSNQKDLLLLNFSAPLLHISAMGHHKSFWDKYSYYIYLAIATFFKLKIEISEIMTKLMWSHKLLFQFWSCISGFLMNYDVPKMFQTS